MAMTVEDPELPRGVALPDASPAEVHFDGACQTVRGRRIAGYGCTIDGGGLRHEESGLAVPPDHPRATNNVAEYVGAIRALEWLAAIPFPGPVVVLGDSELVVRQMNGEYEVRAEHLRPYHERLRQLAERFPRVEFRWVPREQNQRADALSKEGIATVFGGTRRSAKGPREPPGDEPADPTD
jgi:ribonuclease HI